MKKIDSEKLVERKLREGIKAKEGLCIKLLSQHMTGLPDRMVLLSNGVIIFVELKTTGKKPTRMQEIVHAKLRKLGFTVLVIDTVDGVYDLIKTI